MSDNWANNLDMLAQNSILDFDAPAFITGQAPRYVGTPFAPPSPYMGPPLPNAPLMKQPEVDEFTQEKTKAVSKKDGNKNYAKNPLWKKLLFGTVALTALGLGIWKRKSITKWVKNIFSKVNLKSIKKFFVDKGKAIGRFFKKGWNKFTKLFKNKP